MLKESGQQCSFNWQVDRVKEDVQGKSDRHPTTKSFTFDSNIECPVTNCPVRFLAEIRKDRRGSILRKLHCATGICVKSERSVDTGWHHW